jgi:hypothetical protein
MLLSWEVRPSTLNLTPVRSGRTIRLGRRVRTELPLCEPKAHHERGRVPFDSFPDDGSLRAPFDSHRLVACHERASRMVGRASRMVRKGGFEPPRPCGRQPLKLVRLPVSPLPRSGGCRSREPKSYQTIGPFHNGRRATCLSAGRESTAESIEPKAKSLTSSPAPDLRAR